MVILPDQIPGANESVRLQHDTLTIIINIWIYGHGLDLLLVIATRCDNESVNDPGSVSSTRYTKTKGRLRWVQSQDARQTLEDDFGMSYRYVTFCLSFRFRPQIFPRDDDDALQIPHFTPFSSSISLLRSS